ncbi:MAG: ribose 5-phosphate isomerase B [Alphaproteobacteria bacterium]|nr:ribose 5-phosphate isomerase B [Alphaproteobacteria bacterium]
MKIAIGSDHAGVELKAHIISFLEKEGVQVFDKGPVSEKSVDYPDYAKQVVGAIQDEEAEYGILICGTGIGMSIACNRYDFIRGALVRSALEAKLSREHNDANILCLGARITPEDQALECVKVFLETSFSQEERHIRRLDKLGCGCCEI